MRGISTDLSVFSPFCNFLLVPLVAIVVPLLLLALLFTWFLPMAGTVFFLPVGLLLQLLAWSANLLAGCAGGGQYFYWAARLAGAGAVWACSVSAVATTAKKAAKICSGLLGPFRVVPDHCRPLLA